MAGGYPGAKGDQNEQKHYKMNFTNVTDLAVLYTTMETEQAGGVSEVQPVFCTVAVDQMVSSWWCGDQAGEWETTPSNTHTTERDRHDRRKQKGR